MDCCFVLLSFIVFVGCGFELCCEFELVFKILVLIGFVFDFLLVVGLCCQIRCMLVQIVDDFSCVQVVFEVMCEVSDCIVVVFISVGQVCEWQLCLQFDYLICMVVGELLVFKVELCLLCDMNYMESVVLAKEQEVVNFYGVMYFDVIVQVMCCLVVVKLCS